MDRSSADAAAAEASGEEESARAEVEELTVSRGHVLPKDQSMGIPYLVSKFLVTLE